MRKEGRGKRRQGRGDREDGRGSSDEGLGILMTFGLLLQAWDRFGFSMGLVLHNIGSVRVTYDDWHQFGVTWGHFGVTSEHIGVTLASLWGDLG